MSGTSPLADLSYDVPVLGPIGIAIANLGTGSTQVIGPDPTRAGIVFHNPGTQIIRVAPANLTLVPGSGGILIYPQEEEALFSDAAMALNCAWNAVADSDSNNPLTIFNFSGYNASQPAPMPIARLSYGVPIVSPNGIQVSNIGTGSQQVIGRNPMRRGIVFMNPNPYPRLISVCPENLTASSAAAGTLGILPGQEKRIIARNRIRVNCAWNACADAGSGNSLTILEFL
jgi:hypothetical protein